ncbi:Transposase InsO and inactivated derivatives [Brevibacterium jeotgali]|uniref:Transposase InsO and inactivated derivatives n=1 Tax=Brevibacterium jeotgali TaxID=1262550 RepID=A0A2H1LA11_9MICO|nr:transposase InsO family protein [Brevibacterium jeotgali]SMY13303.1 Transposase InsO and inactivated derivatives [Brevibacterium jeotgali]
MMYPLVRDLAAAGVPVAVTCRVLGFSKQAFYAWCAHPVSDRDWDEAHLLNAAYGIHADDPEFGHRFIADELQVAGYRASERRVWRLCSQQRLFSQTVKKARKNGKKPGPPVCDDRVERDFTAEGVNELWLTDITEHRTREGKLYLCAVKDVYSNRIVGYAVDSRMKSRLAVAALNDAVARRGGVSRVAGCVVHSDRGSQFRSRRFQLALKHHGLVASMGRVGAAGDNAAMESFFATLQNNVLDRRTWGTRDELRAAIIHWIERTYHRRRRQRRLGKLTPVEYEAVSHDAVALAA